MPPAPKNTSKGEKPVDNDEGMQAVVLVDSESLDFAPVTLDYCPALVPVAGIPTIEYTLEFLALQNVGGIIINSVKGKDAISEYLMSSRWSKHVIVANSNTEEFAEVRKPSIRVVGVRSNSGGVSAGDALRGLDSMGILRPSTFLLLNGMVISTANLSKAIQFHEQRATADPNVTLTMVLVDGKSKQNAGFPIFSPHLQNLASVNQQPLFLIDESDGRLWDYQLVSPMSPLSKLKVPAGVPKAFRRSLQYNPSFVETGIFICSPQVAIHFSDNYDFKTIESDYIRNEVRNYDMGWSFGTHISTEAHFFRPMQSFRAFLAAQRAVLSGIPSLNPSKSWYTSLSTNPLTWTYFPAQNVLVEGPIDPDLISGWSDSVVFADARVGRGVTLRGSVLSACEVAEGSTVVGSTLALGAVLRDSASVTNSLLFGAFVGVGASVAEGSLLCQGVVLGTGATVGPLARLTTAPVPDDFARGPLPRISVESTDAALRLGEGGVGRVFPCVEETEEVLGQLHKAMETGLRRDEDEEDYEDVSERMVLANGVHETEKAAKGLHARVEAVLSSSSTGAVDAAAVQALAAALKDVLCLFLALRGAPGALYDDCLRAYGLLRRLCPPADTNTTLNSDNTEEPVSFDESRVLQIAVPLSASALFTQTATGSPSPSSSAVTAGAEVTEATAFHHNYRVVPGYPLAGTFARGIADLFLASPKTPEATAVIALELRSLQLAENHDPAEVLAVVVPLLLDLMLLEQTVPGFRVAQHSMLLPSSAASAPIDIKLVPAFLTRWAPLIKKFLRAGDAWQEDKLLLIGAVEAWCLLGSAVNTNYKGSKDVLDKNALEARVQLQPNRENIFGVLLMSLYNLDILDATSIELYNEGAEDLIDGGDEEDEEDDEEEPSVFPIVSKADKERLISKKYYEMLLENIDEEDDDDEEEEDDEE